MLFLRRGYKSPKCSAGEALPAEQEQSQTLPLLPRPRRGFLVANSDVSLQSQSPHECWRETEALQGRLGVAEGGARASVPVQGPTARLAPGQCLRQPFSHVSSLLGAAPCAGEPLTLRLDSFTRPCVGGTRDLLSV